MTTFRFWYKSDATAVCQVQEQYANLDITNKTLHYDTIHSVYICGPIQENQIARQSRKMKEFTAKITHVNKGLCMHQVGIEMS